MIKSMTGFGEGQCETPAFTLSIEVKSYNSKFLDLQLNLPRELNKQEALCRKELQKVCQRGKIELYGRYKAHNSLPSLNEAALKRFEESLLLLKASHVEPSYSFQDLERMAIFDYACDTAALNEAFFSTLGVALRQLNSFRQEEGRHLLADLNKQLKIIDDAILAIDQEVPAEEVRITCLFKTKFNEILGSSLDERRILEEIAAFLVKNNINEELVRLKSHCQSFAGLLNNQLSYEGVGRKLEFLCQELNRETNTINAKTTQLAIQQWALVIKEAIDKLKEQIRNVE